MINENLEANLDNKQELIDELVQVLDEDAESLVNELWDYIETMELYKRPLIFFQIVRVVIDWCIYFLLL